VPDSVSDGGTLFFRVRYKVVKEASIEPLVKKGIKLH
jgi:hypothetical protein